MEQLIKSEERLKMHELEVSRCKGTRDDATWVKKFWAKLVGNVHNKIVAFEIYGIKYEGSEVTFSEIDPEAFVVYAVNSNSRLTWLAEFNEKIQAQKYVELLRKLCFHDESAIKEPLV